MSALIKSSLVSLASLVVVLWLTCFPAPLYAQSSRKPFNAVSNPKTVALKPTPEQERGLRLLKAAEAESTGLQPDMHAFVLWQASYAYSKLDPKHAEKLSRDAFIATQTIEDASENDHCNAFGLGSSGDVKSWIQQRVLYDLIHRDRTKEVEQLLPQATSPVRNEITAELVKYYRSKKDLMHAESLLSQLADSDNYPFGAAAELLTAFGPEHSADRMNIFNEALNNFEQHEAHPSPGGDDIGDFIERTWNDVYPGLVLDAIGKVLQAAKERSSQSHYSMSSAKGNVVFNSDYGLRLFQLLPVLEELDKDKAQALLREQTDVAEQLKAYPRGMQSLNAEHTSLFYGIADKGTGIGPAAADQQIEAQMQDRIETILRTADTDPSGALANALTLPVHGTFGSSSPRSDALLRIAEKAAVKKASVARSALDALSMIESQLTPQEMNGIDRLPELYLKLGDLDDAKKAVDILTKAADKLYEQDTDANDPNKAFKGSWRSTDLWRKAIQEAAKISPSLPEAIIADVQDSEIAAFEKVVFASALIGGSAKDAPILVADCRKNGSTVRVSSSR